MKTINNKTFLQFSNELKGWRFFEQSGLEVYKYELFYKGLKPFKLLYGDSRYEKLKRL